MLIPLLFMTEVVGRLFREFAITLAVSILISLFVSLTLTPMMCARLLRAESEQHHGRFHQITGGLIDRVIAAYDRMLQVVLRHQPLTLLVALATFALTVLLYIVIPKGFFPQQDTGLIQAITQAPQSISFTAMAERQQAAASKALKDPDVAAVSSFIGVDGSNATLSAGRMLIALAACRAQRRPARGHGAAAGLAGHAGRPDRLHATGAGPDHRGPRQPHAIPDDAVQSRPGRAESMDACWSSGCARCPACRT